MNCSICDAKLEKIVFFTDSDKIGIGYYSASLRNIHLPLCPDCWTAWTKLLELLLQRFKELKKIDEDICKRFLE